MAGNSRGGAGPELPAGANQMAPRPAKIRKNRAAPWYPAAPGRALDLQYETQHHRADQPYQGYGAITTIKIIRVIRRKLSY